MTEYRQNATKEEKTSTLRNDVSVQKDTLHNRTSAELDLENTGRHAKPAPVIGRDTVQYPTLPENSWTNDPVGAEPPLGFVDEAPIVGEVGEVQASIDRLERAQSEAFPSNAEAALRGGGGDSDWPSLKVTPPTPNQSPTPTRRKP